MITTIKEWKARLIKENSSTESPDWSSKGWYRGYEYLVGSHPETGKTAFWIYNMQTKEYSLFDNDNAMMDEIDRLTDGSTTAIKEAVSEKSIEKKVAMINAMIAKAIDTDGDPIEVIDKSGTWQMPMVYKPIIYKNGALTIEYTEPYSPGKSNKEKINKSNMEWDGIGTLNDIAKMYRSALKKHNITL